MGSILTAELLISVDGWAGSDGLPGFFGYLGPELEAWVATGQSAPHIEIMGRRTYELLTALPEEARDESWHQMTRQETVLFSRTLQRTDWPGARICGADVVEEVRRMKDEGDHPLRTTGSLSLVRQLMGAGLVDRLLLLTFPLIAGDAGREAAFAQMASADMALADHRVLDGRVLVMEYRPTGNDIPRA